MRFFITKKNHRMGKLNQFLKGRSYSNVIFVMQVFLKKEIQKRTLNQFTNECNVIFGMKHFSGKQNLNLHIELVHGGLKPFKCNDCDKGFSLEGNLKGHINPVHEGKKPFKCNDCDKAFSLKHILNVRQNFFLKSTSE